MIVNDLHYKNRVFDSKYTCYRGEFRSQNDVAITNCIDNVEEFNILEKLIYSDHCPIALSINAVTCIDLNFVLECTDGSMNYDHLDINKRNNSPIRISKINAQNVITEMKKFAEHLLNELSSNEMDNNTLCGRLSESIYEACKINYNTNSNNTYYMLPNNETCNSTHYKAVAKINLFMYKHCCNQNLPHNESVQYLQKWIDYGKTLLLI